MTQVETEVTAAEAFKAAADEARKALAAGIQEDAAPSNESGSSPAIGAESVVPEVVPPATEEASKQEAVPETKTDVVTIDPDAAWNEYKTDEERKKALAHNKAYAAEGWRKAKELEAQLAEKKVETEKAPEAVEQPEVEVAVPNYDEWVSKAITAPDSTEKGRIAALANEYNQYLAEKVTPAEAAVKTLEAKVREAEAVVKDREAALKFLQSRKDPSLYESDIAEAKELFQNARYELSEAKQARLEARDAHKEAVSEQLAKLGVLRRDARTVYDTEISTRRDSVSTKKAEEESINHQKAVDKAWEDSKSKVLEGFGDLTPEAKRFLMNAADGAIVSAASENRKISVEDYGKFIEDALKPFKSTTEKTRQDAVKTVLDVTAEPGPAKATSETKNVDAQPTNLKEWQLKARAVMAKAS